MLHINCFYVSIPFWNENSFAAAACSLTNDAEMCHDGIDPVLWALTYLSQRDR